MVSIAVLILSLIATVLCFVSESQKLAFCECFVGDVPPDCRLLSVLLVCRSSLTVSGLVACCLFMPPFPLWYISSRGSQSTLKNVLTDTGLF